MPNPLLLESLPLEVLHHVLSNLNASELARVRGVSVRLRDLATSNPHWRRVLLSDLVPAYAALDDIATIPSQAWAFSLVHNGWFRAYCAVQRAIREPWLRVDADLVDGPWMVYFKNHLGGNELAGIEEPHMVITFRADNIAVQISGVPLGPRRWWLARGDDGIVKMHATAYPPNEPSREPRTLCRKMEHSTVLMISDAPEFVEALFSLNDTILQEAVRARLITADELDVYRQTIREAKATLPTSLDARNQRLRRVLGFEAPTPSDGSESGDEVGSKR